MSTTAKVVATADRILSEHPNFGDSNRILAKVYARYRFGAELFAERLPGVAATLERLDTMPDADVRRIFFDPLVRLATEDAFTELETGQLASPHRLEDLLPKAIAALPSGLCQSHMLARWDLSSDERHWMWAIAGSSDPYAAQLQTAFDGIFSASPANRGTLLNPDAVAQSKVQDAIALLSMLLPNAGAAALRHVGAIALLDAQLEGGIVLSAAGGDLTPSTVFISLEQLGNPWDIAGCLLHEGLHMKLFDAARSVSLAKAPEETIQVPWRNVRWSIVRAIFAYHVYVHLSLFKAAALCADKRSFELFGDPSAYVIRPHAMSVVNNDTAAQYGRSIDRARYLGHMLQTQWSPLLSAGGIDFVGWLKSSLDPVDEAVFSEAPEALCATN
ncbi:HEXXH motif-containing putative peptide modification protein [Lysobacter sp. Root690]|uniref:aKG-HExxH-type peptide beta-hydroxylase n=1 Tax=Lysobacter sp. Root690 TaxID=1736588 RepID=UPI000AD09362|nr:HEXXH motif-containing putative peptide modification protein [Lysobacter sp. Root690]